MKGFGSRRKDRGKSGTKLPRINLHTWLSIGATMCVFGGLIAGALFGLPALESRLAATAPPATIRVVFEWPPLGDGGEMRDAGAASTWLPRDVQHELIASASNALNRAPDPLSPQGLARVAETAAGSGWFESISSVRRERDGIIRISGDWRIPAAVVRRDGIDYLIARKGEILPMAYERGASPLCAILGAQLDPQRAAGKPIAGATWPGDDVRAGLDLLALVSTRPWRPQVAAVDVGEYASKRRLVLVTTSGGRIMWGGATRDSIPGEVTAEVKLKRLDVLQHQHGRIDGGYRVIEVAGPRTLVDVTATANAQ